MDQPESKWHQKASGGWNKNILAFFQKVAEYEFQENVNKKYIICNSTIIVTWQINAPFGYLTNPNYLMLYTV